MELRQRRGDITEKESKVEEEEVVEEDKKKAQTPPPRKRSWLSLCGIISVVIGLTAVVIIVRLPSPIEPLAYTLPEPPAWEGVLAPNDILTKAERMMENKILGPESIAINGEYVYTGLLTGELIEVHDGQNRTLMRFGTTPCAYSEGTCGRPLGVRYQDRFVYMIDPYYGLFKIHASSGVTERLWSAKRPVNDIPLTFIDDLTVAQDGTIYLTQASTKWNCHQHIESVMEGDKTGRLLKYDPKSRAVTELMRGIRFANGIQLSENEDFLLFAELSEAQIWKYFLTGPRKGEKEIFINNLPGYPDNIRSSSSGGFWIALGGVRRKEKFGLLDFSAPRPWIRTLFSKLIPFEFMRKLMPQYGLAIEVDKNGRIVRSLHDPTGERVHSLTEVSEQDGVLYFGTYAQPYFSRLDLNSL